MSRLKKLLVSRARPSSVSATRLFGLRINTIFRSARQMAKPLESRLCFEKRVTLCSLPPFEGEENCLVACCLPVG